MTATTTDSNADALAKLAPGQVITCTVLAMPRAQGKIDTMLRLMRRDPAARRGLRRAQMLRQRRMHTYIRGNRLYHDREKAARIVRVEVGRSWSFTYTPDIRPDLASVAAYLRIA